MKLIMLGAPGAGKGTQAAILSEKLGIPTISTGNILRAAVKNGTPVGLEAKSYMDAGKLVPDQVIIGIVAERLAQDDCSKGYILDGVPRTIAQAEALEQAGVVFDHVLSIEISDEEIKTRMSGRRFCASCGATYHVVNAPPRWRACATSVAAPWSCGTTTSPRPSSTAWRSIMPRPSLSRRSMLSGICSALWTISPASRPPLRSSRRLWGSKRWS